MKLHLPSGLRKALLACIAAIAAHSVPVTVATGAAFASSGALVSFLLGQQAIAADEDGEDDEDDEYGIMPLEFTGPESVSYIQGQYESGMAIDGDVELLFTSQTALNFGSTSSTANLKLRISESAKENNFTSGNKTW